VGFFFTFLAIPAFLSTPILVAFNKISRTFAVPVKGRRNPLASRREQKYFCTVVSEGVEIALKRKPSLSLESRTELFVQCNQPDCQYVQVNQSPCPLRLDLFAEEIEERERKAQDRRMGS
jgi:hypothetical protein